jgi:deazaflavin-dependent oxidoreductase (nitroreductase family)
MRDVISSKQTTHQRLPLAVRLAAIVLPIFTRGHIFLYRLTGGVIGGRIGENVTLLLTTIGRKTGQQRTTPLAYIAEEDNLIVIAGAAGSAKHPSWWLNLQVHPDVQVQVGKRVLKMRSRVATQEEQDRTWSQNSAQKALYDAMQRNVSRVIPVVVLYPITGSEK